jgi:hypothetical protein
MMEEMLERIQKRLEEKKNGDKNHTVTSEQR